MKSTIYDFFKMYIIWKETDKIKKLFLIINFSVDGYAGPLWFTRGSCSTFYTAISHYVLQLNFRIASL